MKSKSTGKRRPTIGNDPLEAYVPAKRESRDAEADPHDRDTKTVVNSRGGSKVRATFHIAADVLEEARNAVVYLAGPPTRLTLADLAENALKRELERLKKTHNSGRDFPARNGELRGGRPIR
jgi:hypothetical protein